MDLAAATASRSPVPIGAPGLNIAPGDHICAFYPTLAERDDILVPYLRDGLTQGDKCLAVLDHPDSDDLLLELERSVLPTAPDGAPQLQVWSSQQTYLSDGTFDVDEMLDFWNRSVDEAVHRGYESARAVGEMTWALSEMPGVDDLVSYEARLNQFLPHYPQVVLCCLYELERFSGEILVDILKTHPKVLLGGMVLDNPYYLQPEEFLASR